MSYGSSTTTQISTAKLDISLLLKPSDSSSPRKPSAEESDQQSTNEALAVPTIVRAGSVPSLSAIRRVSESSTTSLTTIPSLTTTTTSSRQPSTTITTASDLERAAMDVSPALRPILPPLRSNSPPLHHPMFLQHSALPNNYVISRIHDSYNNPPPSSAKRPRLSSPPPITQPAKRQSKWTAEEDAVIIELRGTAMKWEDISRRLPGRSAISCRLHYQNYLERRAEWDEEKKNRLARLYER